MTLLHSAALGNKNPQIAAALIDAGLSPHERDDTGDTPLHLAATWNSAAVTEFLIEAGADPEAIDDYGHTPLHSLARSNFEPDILATIDVLHKAGADPNTHEEIFGSTPLHDAVSRDISPSGLPRNADPAIIEAERSKNVALRRTLARALLDIGADPGDRDDAGNTPLHKAAEKLNDEAVISSH